VLLDTVLSGQDGIGVLKYISEHFADILVFMITPFAADEVVKQASGSAKFCFLKPIPAENVKGTVKTLLQTPANTANITKNLDRKLSKIFLSIGIPPSILGHQFLKEAIKMAVLEPPIINSITKRLYPEVGEKFNTTASKVERAIRHAIEVAWNKGRADEINAVFGAKVFQPNDRPTNSEFIALLAEKLILEELDR